MNDFTITYAQNREDVILNSFFAKDEAGFYVDVGAYDPDFESVTKLFYLKNWQGINIEPQAERYELFMRERPRDLNIQAGISDKNSTMKLRSYTNQGWSTFSLEMQASYEQAPSDQIDQYQDISVQVTTLRDLFEEYKITSIQFMKIDVEGLEYEALAGNDWKKYRPEVICIEANHVQKDWRKLLTGNHYTLVFFDGLNEYYTADETRRSQQFDYVGSIIFGRPIITADIAENFKKYDEAVAWLEAINTSLKADKNWLMAEVETTQKQAQALQAALNEVTPLRRHIKRHVKYRLAKVDQRVTNKLSRANRFNPLAVPEMHENSSPDDLLMAARHNDQTNFAGYNKTVKVHPLLPVYYKSKAVAISAARKTLHGIRKARP